MANLAIIYPKISIEDFRSIQSIREEHDKRYFRAVDPHITLVFGTDKINPGELDEHVQATLHGVEAFQIRFDSARVVEDDSKEFSHAFVIPSIGYSEINHIHDVLYTGVLESELRHDIPFIPHLGVGTGSKNEMEELVNRLNEGNISIGGIVDAVTIVQYDGNVVTDESVMHLL